MSENQNPFESPKAKSRLAEQSKSVFSRADIFGLVFVTAGLSFLTGFDFFYVYSGLYMIAPTALYMYHFILAIRISNRMAVSSDHFGAALGCVVAVMVIFAANVTLSAICISTMFASGGRPGVPDITMFLIFTCSTAAIGLGVFFGVFAVQKARIYDQKWIDSKRKKEEQVANEHNDQ